MNRKNIVRLLALFAVCLMLNGCRVVALGLAAVGLAGYGAYKVGEGTVQVAGVAAVEGAEAAGSAASAGKDRLSLRGEQIGELIYFGGDFKASHEATVEQLWVATKMAVLEMRFGDLNGTYDALSGNITVLTSEGKKVKCEIKAVSETEAKITIRVGVRGDKDMSAIIHQKITKALETQFLQGK